MDLPEIPRPTNRLTEGMNPLDNRRSILACYEAFKQFVNQALNSANMYKLVAR